MKLILSLAMAYLMYATSAQSQSDTCPVGTTLRYTNGVITLESEARDTLNRLIRKNTRKELLDPNSNVTFELAYNSTFKQRNKPVYDILEVYLQKSFEAGMTEAEAWENYYKNKDQLFLPLLALTTSGILNIDEILEGIRDLENYPELLLITERDETIKSILTLYLRDLASGQRVLAVTHGQGALFINEVFRKLEDIGEPLVDIKRIGISATASPGGGPGQSYQYDTFVRSYPGAGGFLFTEPALDKKISDFWDTLREQVVDLVPTGDLPLDVVDVLSEALEAVGPLFQYIYKVVVYADLYVKGSQYMQILSETKGLNGIDEFYVDLFVIFHQKIN